jgi:hypothetical protein
MGRRCTVCLHPQRGAIDRALAGGQIPSLLAGRYGTTERALQRHRKAHTEVRALAPVVPMVLASATAIEPTEVVPIRTPDQVTAKLEWVVHRCERMHDEAERIGDWRLAKQALDTVVATLDKLARAASMYSDATTVTVDNSVRRLELQLETLSDDQLRALLVKKAGL